MKSINIEFEYLLKKNTKAFMREDSKTITSNKTKRKIAPNFCGLLRKYELYNLKCKSATAYLVYIWLFR